MKSEWGVQLQGLGYWVQRKVKYLKYESWLFLLYEESFFYICF